MADFNENPFVSDEEVDEETVRRSQEDYRRRISARKPQAPIGASRTNISSISSTQSIDTVLRRNKLDDSPTSMNITEAIARLDMARSTPPMDLSAVSPDDAVKLYAMSKINVFSMYAPVCAAQTPEACAKVRAAAYLKEHQVNGSIDYLDPAAQTAIRDKAKNMTSCSHKIHFARLLGVSVKPELGDCVHLDTCERINAGCKSIHYVRIGPKVGPCVMGVPMLKQTKFKANPEAFDALSDDDKAKELRELVTLQRVWSQLGPKVAGRRPSQGTAEDRPMRTHFLAYDVRSFDLRSLGHFGVIMADPPWNVRANQASGIMNHQDIAALGIVKLCNEGMMLLWTTDGTLQFAHQCLKDWGYTYATEITWVKMNQLNRTLVAGRTGHWVNHAKEICLVGIKGDPIPGVILPFSPTDTDAIIAPIRDQARTPSPKPAAIYELVERITKPSTRKLELFGREDNVRPGWMVLAHDKTGLKTASGGIRSSRSSGSSGSSGSGLEMMLVKSKGKAKAGPERGTAGSAETTPKRDEKKQKKLSSSSVEKGGSPGGGYQVS